MTTPTTKSICYDNTRLSAYKTCPRSYFIRHELGWTIEGTADPLVFGSAWHAGQDIVWKYAKKLNDKSQLTELAHGAFCDLWEASGFPLDMSFGGYDRYGARTPGTAKEMYWNYIDQRWNMLIECEVLAIEQPFAVPLPNLPDHWYIGRLDKVVQYASQKLVLEHKSTTAYAIQGGFRSDYIDSWYASSQVKGYQFGAGLYFPGLDGVWVDAALVHKKVHDAFRFIPVSHNIELLREWIGTTTTWAMTITEAKRKHQAGFPLEMTFPKNEDSCFGKYGTCPFLDICRTCADPTKLDGPPPGFKKEMWEPFSILGLNKLVQQSQQEQNHED